MFLFKILGRGISFRWHPKIADRLKGLAVQWKVMHFIMTMLEETLRHMKHIGG